MAKNQRRNRKARRGKVTRKSRPQGRRPLFEVLEGRQMLSADPATLAVEFGLVELASELENPQLPLGHLATNAVEVDLGGGPTPLVETGGGVTKLWSIDRTTTDAIHVADLTGGSRLVRGQFGNSLIVSSGPSIRTTEFVATDGSGSATKDGVSLTSVIAAPDGLNFFSAGTDYRGTELWISDGTTTGTRIIDDLNTGVGSGVSSLAQSVFLGEDLFFQGDDGTGVAVWKYDSGTESLYRIGGSITPDSTPMTSFNNKVIFGGANQGIYSVDSNDSQPEQIFTLTSNEELAQLFVHEDTLYAFVKYQGGADERNSEHRIYAFQDTSSLPIVVVDSEQFHDETLGSGPRLRLQFDNPIVYEDGFVVLERFGATNDVVYYPASDRAQPADEVRILKSLHAAFYNIDIVPHLGHFVIAAEDGFNFETHVAGGQFGGSTILGSYFDAAGSEGFAAGNLPYVMLV
ncbi:MAG: hypothetical protein KDA61_01915, partial [Planctomycetales bacterium]|nr:hypothetical protein [Planctomycetales bacterium]